MSATLPRLSVVVPVHDEAENVTALAEEIRQGLAEIPDWECLWVDDASRDGTLDRLRTLATNDARHRVLVLPQQRGQSAALLCGWHAARFEFVASLDGDGQNDPADLPRLLRKALENGLDMVNGIRQTRQDDTNRRLASQIANAFRNRVTGDHVTDVGCSTRVFRRSFVPRIPTLRMMHRFLPTFIRLAGGRVGEAPVNHRARKRGRSKYGVWDRLRSGLPDTLAVRWFVQRSVTLDGREVHIREDALVASASGKEEL